ncbi:protein YafA [Escherichia coli]|nr:protein YafA [Escherichia coli]
MIVGFYIVFVWISPASFIVLSRRKLLHLICLTEDVPDARQELLNRLLSGKKLTGRDEEDIRRLWQERQDEAEESETRQREQDAIRKFIGEDEQ